MSVRQPQSQVPRASNTMAQGVQDRRSGSVEPRRSRSANAPGQAKEPANVAAIDAAAAQQRRAHRVSPPAPSQPVSAPVSVPSTNKTDGAYNRNEPSDDSDHSTGTYTDTDDDDDDGRGHRRRGRRSRRDSGEWGLFNLTRGEYVRVGHGGSYFGRDPVRYIRTAISLKWSAIDDMELLPMTELRPTDIEANAWHEASRDAFSTSSDTDSSYYSSDADDYTLSDDDDDDGAVYSSDDDDGNGGGGANPKGDSESRPATNAPAPTPLQGQQQQQQQAPLVKQGSRKPRQNPPLNDTAAAAKDRHP